MAPQCWLRSAVAAVCVLAGTKYASAQNYDESIAKELVQYAAAAYANDVQGCLKDPSRIGFGNSTVTQVFNASYLGIDAFGFTAVDAAKQRIYVAFRGTNNVEELIEEFLTSIDPVPFLPDPTYMVNPYFYGAEGLIYDSVKAEVVALMQQYPSYEVMFTGHSLGGSIAHITAFHLGYDGVLQPNRTQFYDFGGPRAGEYPYASQFNTFLPDSIRVTHYKDLVVHFSPCPDILGVCTEWVNDAGWAYHIKTEVWYQEDMPLYNSTEAGSFKVCTGIPYGEDASCANSILIPDSLDDHLYYFGARVGDICAGY